MLYIISKEGIKDEDRRKLLEHANITSEEITAITNLGFMGIKLSQNQKQKGKKGSKGNKKKRDDGSLIINIRCCL
jgi:syntaxin-binding protein 1